ncbi:MAG: MarR family transcriptional regulator [Pseudomonadota bacterium]
MSDKKHHLAVRAVIVFYREFERATREADISISQYRTMLFLKGGAKRAGAIAAAGAVKKPTVSAMLANLRDKGWITDETDPGDARALSVALTPKGRARIDALEDELAARFATIVPAGEVTALIEALSNAYLALRPAQADRIKEVERAYLD